jgi:hypothetical protein
MGLQGDGTSVKTSRWIAGLLALVCITDAAAQIVGMAPPQPDRKFGWAGQAAAKQARLALGAEFPAEYQATVSEEEFKGRVLKLWEFTRDRNGGKHWPVVRQEIGDCVSHGYAHALRDTLAVELVMSGSEQPLVKPYPPYIYGTSRVQIGGGRINGDGSLGAWASAAIKKFGVLPSNASNCPPYSGQVARTWGRSGPPREFLEAASKSLADVRLIKTWEEACSAIATGHAIPVCSDVGFEKIVERNGRIEGVRQGNWPHCMEFNGFDARPGLEALYCANSWGPDAHAPADSYDRLDKAPPGGFWVLRKDVERMLAQEDSFAVSFTGFKAAPLWNRVRIPPPLEDVKDAPLNVLRIPKQHARDRNARVFVPALGI